MKTRATRAPVRDEAMNQLSYKTRELEARDPIQSVTKLWKSRAGWSVASDGGAAHHRPDWTARRAVVVSDDGDERCFLVMSRLARERSCVCEMKTTHKVTQKVSPSPLPHQNEYPVKK